MPHLQKITLIAGAGHQRAIGRTVDGVGTLPWHLPEDLKHFKELTLGKPVIMGRKSWDSLPPKFRPLPGRQNIVVSRNPQFVAEGAVLATSLEAALAAADGDSVFVIGGAELYRQAIGRADALELTEIDVAVPDADAFFPEIDPAQWRETRRSAHVAANGLHYAFVRYERTARP